MSLYFSIRSNAIAQGERAADLEEQEQDWIESGEWALELDD